MSKAKQIRELTELIASYNMECSLSFDNDEGYSLHFWYPTDMMTYGMFFSSRNNFQNYFSFGITGVSAYTFDEAYEMFNKYLDLLSMGVKARWNYKESGE